MVEEGQEFVEEAAAAEGGELVGEAPHAGAQEGEVIVHVLGGGHPECYAVVVWTCADYEALEQMGIRDVLHHSQVQIPFLLLGPVGRIWSVNEVPTGMVLPEGECQRVSSLFVVVDSQDANTIVTSNGSSL